MTFSAPVGWSDDYPLEGSSVYVPKSVELHRGDLVFNPKERKESSQNQTKNAEALYRFINLVNKPDIEVLEFARQWGVLDFCEHGIPFTHSRDNWVDHYRYWNEACLPAGRERIARWKTIAIRFREILNAAASLRRRQGQQKRQRRHSRQTKKTWTWIDVTKKANQWLNYSNVGIKMPETIAANEHSPKIQISCSSLFDVLVVQLWMAILEARQLMVCEECGDLFGSRAPRRLNERTFCADCRSNGVPERYAATDLRMRKARALALFREGKQVEEIAPRVKSKRETIQRWLEKTGVTSDPRRKTK